MAKQKKPERKQQSAPAPSRNNSGTRNSGGSSNGNRNSGNNSSKPKPKQQAVAKALKDKKIDLAEAQQITGKYGDKGVQAIAKALATKKKYELGKEAAQFTGLRDKKDGVYFKPHLTDPLTPWWIGINGVGAGKPRSSTDSPGKGWVNVGTNGTQPRYRFVGKGYKDLRIGGGGGGGNGGGGRVDRSTGNYQDIRDALREDRNAARDWQDDLRDMLGIGDGGDGGGDFGLGGGTGGGGFNTGDLGQDIANSALQQQQQLDALLKQQQLAYAEQQRLQQQQIAAAQAAYAEQQRQASALSRAYVPGLNDTAYSPLVGDMRNTGSSTLSSLAILNNGSGMTSLQIA